MRPLSSPSRDGTIAARAGLVLLAAAEVVALSLAFDTGPLDRIPSFWARLLGWTPALVRASITALVVATLVSGAAAWRAVRESPATGRRLSWRHLSVHLVALAGLVFVSRHVFSAAFPTAPHQGLWAALWVALAAVTMATLLGAAYAWTTWTTIVVRTRAGLVIGGLVGASAWAGGFFTQQYWAPLARATFAVVSTLLGGLYPDLQSDPTAFRIGTSTFAVNIAPACSGYEGIGLVVAFLAFSLWASRAELRFPHALVILPLAAAAIWVLNAVRIALLVVIGASGWPAIALGGFHSQAGWLAFNAVGLGFVALSLRVPYFAAVRPAAAALARGSGGGSLAAPAAVAPADGTAAYLAPFLTIVAVSMMTGAVTGTFDWLYPARVVAAGLVCWNFRRHYAALDWSWAWSPVGIGAVVAIVWIGVAHVAGIPQPAWPQTLVTVPEPWATGWMAFRLIGYVALVPFAEELAFRGYLLRRLIGADFERVPMGAVTLASVLVSSLVFGALHGPLWIAGTLAGLLFTLALRQTRTLAGAVVAHATTNGLLALYAATTGHWQVWS